MIERRARRHSLEQLKLANHTTQFTACAVQMESTDGIKREENLCVIPTARSFSGMAF